MSNQATSSDSDLENRIMALLKSTPKGVTQKVIQDSMPSLNVMELVKVLNKFIAQDKIELKKKGAQLVYALKEANSLKRPTDAEENILFEAIKRAGNNGIAPRDLKSQCNLAQSRVTQLLKSMESKRLVQSIVSSTRKKLWVLWGVVPSEAVTGGTFYHQQEFETELVEAIATLSYRFLQQAEGDASRLGSDAATRRRASSRSVQEVTMHINSLKVSKVEMRAADIFRVLESLVYDRRLERSEDGTAYRTCTPLVDSAPLVRTPCGVCPVYQECGVRREVSPLTCEYLKEWLGL